MTFNDSIDIPAWLLYEKGSPVDVSYEDFITFTKKNVVDTTKACDLLECTRQNLSYLVKQHDITPIMTGVTMTAADRQTFPHKNVMTR